MTSSARLAEKASVLVVDDMPEYIDILTGLLKGSYTVRAAVDGPTALSLVHKFPPDIILLDIMLPGMSGYDVCRALRNDPFTRHIPVIFVTAMNEVRSEKEGLDLGAVDYITKPFSPPLVLARVRNHLALQDQRRALEQEVQARTRELADTNAVLADEVVARDKAMERAEYLFNYDALTGLPHRRQFIERFERMISQAREAGDSLALIGVSLDRFNVVKTTLGGAVSDQMLLQTASRRRRRRNPGPARFHHRALPARGDPGLGLFTRGACGRDGCNLRKRNPETHAAIAIRGIRGIRPSHVVWKPGM